MCGIILSKDLDTFINLANQNQYRGSFSYSITVFDQSMGVISLVKDFGLFDETKIPSKNDKQLYIGHVQAPTGGLKRDSNRIHPSILETDEKKSYLWHNGILKKIEINRIQTKLKNTENWDTKLLHMILNMQQFSELSDIDGSFGCLYITQLERPQIFTFTTDIIPLYIDNCGSISSAKFPNSKKISPNTVFELIENNLIPIYTFTSKSSPYYFFT